MSLSTLIYRARSALGTVLARISRRDDMANAKAARRSWSKRIKAAAHPVVEIRSLMSGFVYKADDRWLDWAPNDVDVIFARHLQGDCDDAAVLAQWGFAQAGMPGEIWRLKREGGGHLIFVTQDRRYFTSNERVIVLGGAADWRAKILDWGWHKGLGYSFDRVLG